MITLNRLWTSKCQLGNRIFFHITLQCLRKMLLRLPLEPLFSIKLLGLGAKVLITITRLISNISHFLQNWKPLVWKTSCINYSKFQRCSIIWFHMLVASITTNAPEKNTCFLLVNKDGIVSDENFKNCTFKTKKNLYLTSNMSFDVFNV